MQGVLHFTIYRNQSQTSPVPSVSFQHPECINVASWPSHQKNKENNDYLQKISDLINFLKASFFTEQRELKTVVTGLDINGKEVLIEYRKLVFIELTICQALCRDVFPIHYSI